MELTDYEIRGLKPAKAYEEIFEHKYGPIKKVMFMDWKMRFWYNKLGSAVTDIGNSVYKNYKKSL